MSTALPPSLRAGGPRGPIPGDAGSAAAVIDIGLVNNMPDSALKGTERQFLRLLAAASDGRRVRLHLFTLTEIGRSERARQHCEGRYGRLDELLASQLDGLIVTGAEPRAAMLEHEPYWRSLTAVFDWAAANTTSTILSCLAAHAAVLHFDGIERRRLPHKCTGVFEHAPTGPHPLTEGGPAAWRVAHSRWNEIPETALEAHRYQVLTRSEQAGPDLFVRESGSLFVHCQGHPEYDRDTLLKEYQRDVRRYLAGEQAGYPTLPHDYLGEAAARAALEFEALSVENRTPETIERFPSALLDPAMVQDWSAPARCLYRNWLDVLVAAKPPHLMADRPQPDRSPHKAVLLA